MNHWRPESFWWDVILQIIIGWRHEEIIFHHVHQDWIILA